MNILGIDTAGPVISVAWKGQHGERQWQNRIVRNADSMMMPIVHDFVQKLPIDAIAVSIGPGAFTGLRVGVSVALGLAESRGLKVFPISSLLARASLVKSPQTLAVLDARKSKVYAQLFDSRPSIPIPLNEAVDADIMSVIPSNDFVAVGEGAIVYSEAISKFGRVVTGADRGGALALVRLASLCAVEPVEPTQVALHYIREADAIQPKSLGIPIGKPA
jgi:tRNA threonylcarbamoyladenosine biosynthesis protein TsaB